MQISGYLNSIALILTLLLGLIYPIILLYNSFEQTIPINKEYYFAELGITSSMSFEEFKLLSSKSASNVANKDIDINLSVVNTPLTKFQSLVTTEAVLSNNP